SAGRLAGIPVTVTNTPATTADVFVELTVTPLDGPTVDDQPTRLAARATAVPRSRLPRPRCTTYTAPAGKCTAYTCQAEKLWRRHVRKESGQTVQQAEAVRRVPLSRDRVLRAAVALVDDAGIESLNMRRLAQD